jgi:hypothetical protein
MEQAADAPVAEFPRSSSSSASRSASSASPQPADGALRVTTVTDREVANGRTQWAVTFSDGVTATTIHKGLGEGARDLAASGATVTRQIETKGRFVNLTGLLEIVTGEVRDDVDNTPDEDSIPF